MCHRVCRDQTRLPVEVTLPELWRQRQTSPREPFRPYPSEDLTNDSGLLMNRFKEGLAASVVNGNVAIAERCVRHYVQ